MAALNAKTDGRNSRIKKPGRLTLPGDLPEKYLNGAIVTHVTQAFVDQKIRNKCGKYLKDYLFENAELYMLYSWEFDEKSGEFVEDAGEL